MKAGDNITDVDGDEFILSTVQVLIKAKHGDKINAPITFEVIEIAKVLYMYFLLPDNIQLEIDDVIAIVNILATAFVAIFAIIIQLRVNKFMLFIEKRQNEETWIDRFSNDFWRSDYFSIMTECERLYCNREIIPIEIMQKAKTYLLLIDVYCEKALKGYLPDVINGNIVDLVECFIANEFVRSFVGAKRLEYMADSKILPFNAFVNYMCTLKKCDPNNAWRKI
jgi:hypothetical protein